MNKLPPPSSDEGWYPDPLDSDRERYWDGKVWTELTEARGTQEKDLADSPPPPQSSAQVEPGVIPAGWYPDHSDPSRVRFWNGSRWTDHTAPRAGRASAGSTSSKAIWVAAAAVLVAVVVALAFAQGFGNSPDGGADDASSTRSSEDRLANSPSPTPEPERPAATRSPSPLSVNRVLDRPFEDAGFEVVESGELYVRALEENEFTCGAYTCLGYVVYTVSGCPSSLYVEASVLSGGTVVGFANDLVGAVRPGEMASVVLEDYTNQADMFRISEVNCY